MPARILSLLCVAGVAAGVAAGQQLVLKLAGPARVHEGELISVRLEFRDRPLALPAQVPAPFLWSFNGFRVNPPPDCRRYSLACFPNDMWTFDKFDPLRDLVRAQLSVVADINPSVPSLKPGSYRIRAVMTKQVLKYRAPMQTGYGYAEPRQNILSNTVAVEVIPATNTWVRRTIEEARKVLLDADLVQRPEGYERRKRAARQIGFLFSVEAFEAALDLHGKTGGREMLFGIYRNPNEAQSCELLRQRLKSPQHCVTDEYIRLMANVCRRARFPFTEEIRRANEKDPRRVEWSQKIRAYEEEITQEAIGILAARFTGDHPHAAVDRIVVLRHVATRSEKNNEALPAFAVPALEAMSRQLASEPPRGVVSTLAEFGHLLRIVNVRTALEAILRRNPFDHDWIEARRRALRLLLEIDPAAGRQAGAAGGAARVSADVRRSAHPAAAGIGRSADG